MKFSTSRIIDSNGTKFRVGWDEYGWFTIDRGELWGEEGEEPEFYSDDSDLVSFDPAGAEELIAAVEEGL